MTLARSKKAVAAALILTLALAVPVAQAAPAPRVSIPVVGTTAAGGAFSGVFNLASFAVQDGQVVAVGTISGVLTSATGASSVLSTVALPAAIGATTCDILHLDIGPIALDLLGLQVDLSQIVLDITAQAGAGNLLGNLLCSVAGLLDSPGGLARLLNQILSILG